MQIQAIFIRWIEVLAGLVEAFGAVSQTRRSVVVTQVNGCFVVQRFGASNDDIIVKVVVGTKMPNDLAETLRKQFIIFEIAADKVVTRRLTVPAQAQEFLAGIVRNQIERLSPWPPALAVYGLDAKPNPNDVGSLDVTVSIASRASINAICEELTETGLAPHKIAMRTVPDIKASLVTLWTRPVQSGPRRGRSLNQIIGAGLVAMVALSTVVSLWAIYATNAASAEREDVASRAAVFQRQSQPSRKARDLSQLKPPQRAWAMKENSPAAVLALEALSRALPDNAYLTDLELDNTTLHISGLTTDAPSLIASLEQSGRFSATRFLAPTTKTQGKPLYKFYIETRVDEHPELLGN